MHKTHGLLAGTLLALSFSGDALATSVTSSFDSGDEGWTLSGNQGSIPIYNSAGGNPGGFVSGADNDTCCALRYAAPAPFLGNKAAFFGGVLAYSFRTSFLENIPRDDDVLIAGANGTTIKLDLEPPQTADIWQAYTLRLDASADWIIVATDQVATDADILSVLADIAALEIGREVFSNQAISETTGIDEVSLIADITLDTDQDGVFNKFDNCINVPNPAQRDTNMDGFGNLCDADLNGDCVVNVTDLGVLRTVFFSAEPDADFDGDGVVNFVDLGIMRTLFFSPPGPSGDVTQCASP